MGFGGGRSSTPAAAPKEVVEEIVKPTKREQDDAAALRARKRGAGLRSLLSPTREDAAAGLGNKLGGGSSQ